MLVGSCIWGTICKYENGTPKVARNVFNIGEVWNPVCCHGNKTVKLKLWSLLTELKNDCACVTYDPVGGSLAGKSRLEQQIPNVKSITERWRYFVDFLHDFEGFSFPKRFIYLCGIAFSCPYRWNFQKARDFVYFIDPLLCIVASRAPFLRHRLLTSR